MIVSDKPREAEAVLAAQIADQGFLPHHRELLHPGIVEKLAELAREKVRVNAQESLQLAAAALVWQTPSATRSRAPGVSAPRQTRCGSSRNQAAVETYDKAVATSSAAAISEWAGPSVPRSNR